MQFSSGLSIGGATLAGFDLPTAQRLMNKEGQLDEIAIAAKPDATPQQLVSTRSSEILPPGTQVQTGAEQAASDAADTNEFITFLQGFLLAFGGIALFVGAFVIANSLSITIAQRTRELATLRTLGASRRQVLGSIIVEALVVGIVASLVGLFLGLLLAKGLFRLFDAVGFTLPNTGLVFETRTVVVALLAGILVTLLASLRPAIRATRVPPIAAVREGATLPPGRFRALRGAARVLMTAVGFAALLYGLFASGLDTTQVLIWMGLGALLVFLGVALFSSRLVRRSRSVLGRAGGADRRSRGRPGARQRAPQPAAHRLDRGRADDRARARHARRDARGRHHASFEGAVNDLFTGDYAITAQNNFSPIPIEAAEAAAQAPGVTAVGNVRTGETLVFGRADFATAVDAGHGAGHRHGLGRGLAEGLLGPRRGRRLRRRRLRRGQRPRGSDRRSRSRSRTAPDEVVRRRRGSSIRPPAARRSAR